MSSTMKPETQEKKAAVQNGVKRLIFTVISGALQILLFVIVFTWLEPYKEIIIAASYILAALLVLAIYNQEKTSAMKMPWIILILVFPLFGSVLYLLIGLSFTTKTMSKKYIELEDKIFPLLPENKDVQERLAAHDKGIANMAHYFKTHAGYPAYDNTDIVYYPDGVDGLEAQKEELKKAEKFIFMEYHAIENAESWHGIQEILEEKVQQGVDVRVFYDDMGSIGFINTDFVKLMESKGIQCRVFNPFKIGINMFLNNRDHRKITVIDGRVGFTGGYNLANEYFHITEPFGFWKDTGVKITGPAVKSLTVAFLEMWNAIEGRKTNDTEFAQYLPDIPYEAKENAFIVPYADIPINDERVGENAYISMAEYARDYCWFVTPYLILTDEMISALGMAAKRGVDVRVITPGIPDKKIIYNVTRSYYNALVKNGVRVYEFTPGFCHCKMSVADGNAAICGTINLDYRSLYHHFENACLFANCNAVADVKKDFDGMLTQAREVTQDYMHPKAGKKFFMLILRLFAPLM